MALERLSTGILTTVPVNITIVGAINGPPATPRLRHPVQGARVQPDPGLGRRRRVSRGLGIRRRYEVLADEVQYAQYGDRFRFQPDGLFGGEPGAAASCNIERDGEITELASKESAWLRSGDVLTVSTGGGGLRSPGQAIGGTHRRRCRTAADLCPTGFEFRASRCGDHQVARDLLPHPQASRSATISSTSAAETESEKRPAAAIGLQSTPVKAVAITLLPYFSRRRHKRNAMLVIHAVWDSEAGCWCATSDEFPGLATGADTIEILIERLKVIVPELVELNGIPVAERVSFELRARRRAIAD